MCLSANGSSVFALEEAEGYNGCARPHWMGRRLVGRQDREAVSDIGNSRANHRAVRAKWS